MKTVIFAGGVGTRLWPLSRKKSPKQFEGIIGSKSTLQMAAQRLQPDFAWGDMYIATSADYVELVRKQLPHIPGHHVIGEPVMRDVGPAVGLMASILTHIAPDEPMVVLWSDHLVKRDKTFRSILSVAGEYVVKHPKQLVFVAQKPRFASENLGWIQYGKKVHSIGSTVFHDFVDFQYRPDKETAKQYFASGHHAWNLGYFVIMPSFLWELYEQFAPNLAPGLSAIGASWGTPAFTKKLSDIYPTLEKISFDNAILEKLNAKHAKVISENIEWSDIGAWEALKEALQESKDQNVTQGKVMLTDTHDSLVYNFTKQLLITIDIKNALVISTDDVVLVCNKNSVPKIKKLVESFAGTEHENLT